MLCKRLFVPMLVAASAAVLLYGEPLSAQLTTGFPTVGDRVRVTSPQATGVFTVTGTESGVLVVQNRVGLVRVHTDSINRLEVSRGQRSLLDAARVPVLSGIAVGGVAGAVWGYNRTEQRPCSFPPCFDDKAFEGCAIGTVAGAALGGLIGLATRGERWQKVHLPNSIAVVPGAAGAVRIELGTGI